MHEFTSTIEEYYNKIHDIPLLYCIILAVVIPFLVIVVGYFINLIGEALGQIIAMATAPVVANAIVNFAFFPGVMIHELAHAFLAVITGAKITEVALFKVEDGSLGHVNFRNRGNIIIVALQNVFISSAPMFVGAAVCIGCGLWLSVLPAGYIWLKVIIWYLMISMFFHMTMSPADIKVYIKGVPLFIIILFIVFVPLRLTGVI